MSYSIYHFFAHLVKNWSELKDVDKLENFSYPNEMLSCRMKGKFPDMAIRLNQDNHIFCGGELVELKDAKGFNISSFNSTIPSSKKEIAKLVCGKRSKIRDQMVEAGDDIDSLAIRDVYYLVRGRKDRIAKICLVNGKFFETIPISSLVKESFEQVLNERLIEKGEELPDDVKRNIVRLFDDREVFAKTRHVNRASVNLRFRVMAEVSTDGNILHYDEIIENSLTFLVPVEDQASIDRHGNRMRIAFEEFDQEDDFANLNTFEIGHKLNGHFLAFQISL